MDLDRLIHSFCLLCICYAYLFARSLSLSVGRMFILCVADWLVGIYVNMCVYVYVLNHALKFSPLSHAYIYVILELACSNKRAY